jgi:hypothetical protein
MNFLISEYISLLKEDGELDTLLLDILNSKGIVPISKPKKGRQYGVDIAAIGKDENGVKKVFLITVKQGNITRSVWDSGPTSVRQSLNEIKETYLNISLTPSHKKLPKKIIVATNGELEQTVQTTWTQYIGNNEDTKLEYQFWGQDNISKMVNENLLSERLFNAEMRSLLRKTLAFLELKDYDLRHYKNLVDLILDKPIKTKKPLLKRLKLLQICLNIVFKWAQDNGYLKLALQAADKTLIKSFEWLDSQDHFKETYIRQEFFHIHSLRREIGISYFNKVYKHYLVEHGLHRYSKNQIEYGLTVWEEIGILANIGLTEIRHYQYHSLPQHQEMARVIEKSCMNLSEALVSLIETNPPSHFPLYDNHLIDIEPAMRFLYLTGKKEACKKWLRELIVGIFDAKVLKGFFPLFRENFENLVEFYLGNKKQDEKSSMLLALLADWSVILESDRDYQDIKMILGLFDNKLNLQIWFPKKETEECYLKSAYSQDSGKVKHSITLYDSLDDFKKELLEEVDLFSVEPEFRSIKMHEDYLFNVAAHYHRELPFPYFWRRLISP